MPRCDVCSGEVNFEDGYALTTRDVVTAASYWTFMLERHHFDDGLLAMYVQQQALQGTGWLVCPACADMFRFNRALAREYARRQANPPGTGPVPVREVAVAAVAAWRSKHGRPPSWVR